MTIDTLDTERAMPLVKLPLRTTVVTLASGARVLLAPASTFSPERFRELAKDGEITDVVVPNLFHTEGVVPAAKAFPNARLWGPVGIEAKKLDVRWHGTLGRDPWPHDELPAITLEGMPSVAETVFVHSPTRTLVVADLAFHMVDASGLGARIVYGLFGTYRRFGVSRLLMRTVKDRGAFEGSLRTLFEHDFDALIPSHGALVSEGAKERLRDAFAERDCKV
ncbi:MAG: DUF4336 domain-containing protein [Myxococcales bacterium]|nr:DUF4336 domain-containing protein [Myxococcales bacterium]